MNKKESNQFFAAVRAKKYRRRKEKKKLDEISTTVSENLKRKLEYNEELINEQSFDNFGSDTVNVSENRRKLLDMKNTDQSYEEGQDYNLEVSNSYESDSNDSAYFTITVNSDSDSDSINGSESGNSDFSNISSEEESTYYEKEEEKTMIDKLREWGLSSGTSFKSMDELLEIVKPVIPDLPKTSKTFFKALYDYGFTIESFPSLQKNSTVPCQFVYFGIAEHLKLIIHPSNHEEKELISNYLLMVYPFSNHLRLNFGL